MEVLQGLIVVSNGRNGSLRPGQVSNGGDPMVAHLSATTMDPHLLAVISNLHANSRKGSRHKKNGEQYRVSSVCSIILFHAFCERFSGTCTLGR